MNLGLNSLKRKQSFHPFFFNFIFDITGKFSVPRCSYKELNIGHDSMHKTCTKVWNVNSTCRKCTRSLWIYMWFYTFFFLSLLLEILSFIDIIFAFPISLEDEKTKNKHQFLYQCGKKWGFMLEKLKEKVKKKKS